MEVTKTRLSQDVGSLDATRSEICPNNCPQTEHDARGKLRASRNKGAGWDQSSSIRFKGGPPKLTATKLAQEGSE